MTAPCDALLTLNAGSSSVKFALFGLTPDLPRLAAGQITGIGNSPCLHIEGAAEDICLPAELGLDDAVARVLDWLRPQTGIHLQAAAHRIVHGGSRFAGPVELDATALAYLRSLIPLAPLHQPHNLAAVGPIATAYPGLRQFGCFDTAFHAGLGPLATRFALPAGLYDHGVRRYGFHGLSYAWIARNLPAHLTAGNVVAAHLGNGASLCAMTKGQSVDTTMGMTALDGLPMGTRCGALDPGAVLYMEDELGLTTAQVAKLLYEESGLKGLSGQSNDVAALVRSSDPNALFALDYFVRKTAQHIAAMGVSLGGIDAVVFTGGIGEHAAALRERIVAALSWLPAFQVLVIPADEERAMATEVLARYADQIVACRN